MDNRLILGQTVAGCSGQIMMGKTWRIGFCRSVGAVWGVFLLDILTLQLILMRYGPIFNWGDTKVVVASRKM